MNVLDLIDPNERRDEEILSAVVAAMADLEDRTGDFFRNASSEDELQVRIRFAAAEIREAAAAAGVSEDVIVTAVTDAHARAAATRKKASDVLDFFKNSNYAFQSDEDKENDNWSIETEDGETRTGFESREEAEAALREGSGA